MNNAYKVAASAVLQRFAEQDPAALDALASIRKKDIAVYAGSFDQSEKAMELLGIPYVHNPSMRRMAKARAVFVNCSNQYNQEMVGTVAGFVEAGGLLVTSDWAVKYVLEPAFPGMVRHNGRKTNEEVIAVEPNLDSVWEDVLVLGADPQWWLWCSYPVEVLNPEKVRVEAASHALMVHYEQPAVAVTFDWGQGSVYHIISHFWARKSGTPSNIHSGPFEDFLRRGMHLSEEGIRKVVQQHKRQTHGINFAKLQSAATALELVAKLCIRACRN